MTASILIVLLVIAGVIVGLSLGRTSPDVILLAGLAVLLISGELDASGALSGFSNEGLATIGVLFVVAEGLRQTGGVGHLGQILLGRPDTVRRAQARIVAPVAVMSSIMNNTPVVAMALPIVGQWAKKHSISVSHLLLPLSYASILGGMVTLIGTSTTLVVNGLLIEQTDHPGMRMFEISWVGIPIALAGLAYMLAFAHLMLPERKPAITPLDDPREYTIEMIVEAGSSLEGRTIEAAGLRQLPGAYLIEIARGDRVIAAVGPHERLEGSDRLTFVGVVESVVDLNRIPGLSPSTGQVRELEVPSDDRCLVEAVVSSGCRFVAMTVRESQFRSVYGAAIIAIARDGERVVGKIGDITLRPGDTLLLMTHRGFAEAHRNSRDFFLVSEIEDSAPPRHEKAWIARAILLVMVVLVTTEFITMLQAAVLAAAGMLATGCVRSGEAKRAVDWSVLLAVGSGLGLGIAMERSGAADLIATQLLGFVGDAPVVALALVLVSTMILGNVVTTQAAAVLMFPVGMAAAAQLDAPLMAFAIAIVVGAACSFATPIGYQTNLMVYGPGGYRTSDFLRFGIPLSVIVIVVAVAVIPVIYPL